MKTILYQYPRCSTCKKATKWLDQHRIKYTSIDITEHPPSESELRRMLGHYDGTVRRLFNTSGVQYRALDMKSKLPGLTSSQALKLLAGNGKLVKRPFVLTDSGGLVGFREPEWDNLFRLRVS